MAKYNSHSFQREDNGNFIFGDKVTNAILKTLVKKKELFIYDGSVIYIVGDRIEDKHRITTIRVTDQSGNLDA